MNDKLISKLENFTIWRIIIETLALAFLALFLLSKAIGIQNLEQIIIALNTFKDVLFLLVEVMLALLFFVFFSALIRWIRLDEGILIRPFESTYSGSLDGQSISNMLVMDLQKIRQVHDWASRQKWSETIDSTKDKRALDFLPVPVSNYETVDYNLFTSLGTFSLGSLTISVGQMLLILKKFLGTQGKIISGSVQKNGSTMRLSGNVPALL